MMKYTILLLSFLSLPFLSSAQIVDIPDQGFKDYLIGLGVDANGDGEIQNTEAEVVMEIDIPAPTIDLEVMSLVGVKAFTNLEVLIFDATFITEVDLDGMTSLEDVEVMDFLSSMDITLRGCTTLKSFSLRSSFGGFAKLIDLTGCTSLVDFNLDSSGDLLVEDIRLTDCSSLERLIVEDGLGEVFLNVDGCSSLRTIDVEFGASYADYSFSNLPSLDTLIMSGNLGAITISGTPVLTHLELVGITSVDVTGTNALQYVRIDGDFIVLPEFILENQPQLVRVDLNCNVQGAISFAGCVNLEVVETFSIIHVSLDVSNCRKLMLAPLGNEVISADLTNCSAITEIETSSFIEHLNCTGMTSLQVLNAEYAGLETLVLDGCYNLRDVTLFIREAAELDFSPCSALENVTIIAAGNSLRSLIMKNGANEVLEVVELANTLENVCADPEEIQTYTDLFVDQTNLTINDDCPFANTNKPFSISGASYLDINQDSCSTSMQKLPYSKYSLLGESGVSATFFAGADGSYDYYLPEGTYTYMPEVLYGSDLFVTFPESNTVSFDNTSQPVTQDFCYISSQDLDIVDVTLIPLEEARPGFDASYRITYTNTGSIIKDGDIVLEFPDDVLDLVSASPMVTTEEEGLLSWSFEGLIPFETRSIDFTMNLNSPMEDPALGSGSILNYTARVSPIGNVTITSYWSYLNQEVVNSFDPNDKTCLDGDVLNEELVGQSLKYMIRFENTGTADAVNVVVVDTLDEASYDIRSLEVLNASHDLRTELEGNIVKFIFENIYLPFEDATNDGYVTFRINTLDDLELGHDIRNRAGIYFDFNFPIITNTTTTVISDLTTVTDLVPGELNISYYPNPTNRQVQITSDEPIEAIELLTLDGRVCAKYTLAQPVGSYSLPLEGMLPGVYLVSIRSGGKTATGRVIVQ